MQLRFSKMNGAGNDFVMLDNRNEIIALQGTQIAHLCDRHRGIGADGVLLVEPARSEADFRMRYYNADGGEAEMCGNGARCFARFASRFLDPPRETISFETLAGVIRAKCAGDGVEITMSAPHSLRAATELVVNGRSLPVSFLNTGVPHAALFVADIEAIDINADGRALRYHEAFAPRGTNANFVQVLAPGSLAIRTYERGVEGETLACGTGVVASALLHHVESGASSPIQVRVRGGDTLKVAFVQRDDGVFSDVTLTGPADFVFEGTISF